MFRICILERDIDERLMYAVYLIHYVEMSEAAKGRNQDQAEEVYT
jgi:hypothetical protein